MDEMTRIWIIIFATLAILPIMGVTSTYFEEIKCREFASSHEYEFIRYKGSGLFTNSECWGFKDGQSVRLY